MVCTDGFGIFSCDCINGFIVATFVKLIVRNVSPSCQNGVCIDGINSFTYVIVPRLAW